MADTLGTVTLNHIDTYAFDDGHIIMSGYEETKAALNTIETLFTKARGNTSVHRILGGGWKGVDLTADYENWHEAAFDADQLFDGWHLLLGFKYHPQNLAGHYPYTLEMHWFCTTASGTETVGVGDGTETIYNLDNVPVVPTSENVYVGGTLQGTYNINYDEGEITFDSAPGAGGTITATYDYFCT